MNFKEIFQEGMKEWKRKKALKKKTRDFEEKKKAYQDHLTALGRKAWESKVPVDGLGDLKETLEAVKKELDELGTRSEELKKQKQVLEEKKSREAERLKAGRDDAEGKKREVDERLNMERNTLRVAQLEAQQAAARLAAIPPERDFLNKKNLDAAVPEAEREAIRHKLESLAAEERSLQAKSPVKTEEIRAQNEKVALIQSESDHWQKKIDAISAEETKVVGELDQSIAGLDKELNDCGAKLKEAEKRQESHFLQLGEKAAACRISDAAVAPEMAAVQSTGKSMADIKAESYSLQGQQSDAGLSAYRKMLAISVSGAVLIVAVIILLIVLL
jgi:chromosome segregation ATPase